MALAASGLSISTAAEPRKDGGVDPTITRRGRELEEAKRLIDPDKVVLAGDGIAALLAVVELRKTEHRPALSPAELDVRNVYVIIEKSREGGHLVAITPNLLTGQYSRLNPHAAPPVRSFLYHVSAQGVITSYLKQ